MPPDSPSYIARSADHTLYSALIARDFCYVLTSRQMGKSSLVARTAARLREVGIRVGSVDLTALGRPADIEQWYDGFLLDLGRRLGLEDELEDYWFANTRVQPTQ